MGPVDPGWGDGDVRMTLEDDVVRTVSWTVGSCHSMAADGPWAAFNEEGLLLWNGVEGHL